MSVNLGSSQPPPAPGLNAHPYERYPFSRAHAELDPDQPIVVLCHHGARSLSVTMWMRNAKASSTLQSLAGGIDEWSAAPSTQLDPSLLGSFQPPDPGTVGLGY